jgi:MFS family permease
VPALSRARLELPGVTYARPRGGLRRDLRLSIGDAAGYGAMAGLAEVYLPAFGLALGLSPVLAGLIASAPMLAGGLIQLLAPRAIPRVRSLRRWVVGCMVVQALAFAPLVALALAGTPSAAVVFASAGLYWAAGMSATAAWNPWMARIVPERIRSAFFGRRQGVGQATMLVGLIGAGVALTAVAGTAHVLEVYAAMFALALVARLGSAVMVARQGVGVDPAPRRRMRFRSIPPRLRGTGRASMLAYIVAAIGAAGISGPFLTPFLLHHEGYSYGAYAIFTAMIVVAKIGALPLIGRAIERFGVRRVLTISALGITPVPLFVIISTALPWLLVVQIYAGIVWAGFELGLLMALFDANDDAERTTMQSALSGLQSIATAGASFVGGAILGSLGEGADAYFWVFVASAVARFAAVVLLVHGLPAQLARFPQRLVRGAWTIAIRPWGGTIVQAFVEGLGKLGRRP